MSRNRKQPPERYTAEWYEASRREAARICGAVARPIVNAVGIVDVTGIAPWDPATEARLGAIARRMFRDGHSYEHRGIDADNCSFCALVTGGFDGPNYAGWARLYIEAGQRIPGKWRHAFVLELESDNKAYADALLRSIATFGQPKFLDRWHS